MAEMLTAEQLQAVRNRGGDLLVSAAAGSGKTKVLVERLMGYLTDPQEPANVDDFLIITYTKAAASELRGKIADRLAMEIALQPENRHLQKQMQRLYLASISTVHGFCGDLLREYVYRLDLPGDFRVADENECRELRELILEGLLNERYAQEQPDEAFLAFVDTQGLGRTDSLVPEIVQKVYDSARCHLDPPKWLERCLRDSSCQNVTRAEQTPWGRFLMDDLRDYLDLQLGAMTQCVEIAGSIPGWEKPAALLAATVEQLRTLRESETWDDVYDRKEIDYGRLVFPKKGGDLETADRIKAVREGCKKGLSRKLASFSDPNRQVMEDLKKIALAARGLVELVTEFGSRLDAMKKSRRIVDFGDLEHRALDLLLGKRRDGATKIAQEVGSRFREIMVDEYQDSNAVQDAIFSALTRERRNLFLVGDVKQSIYQFRLADPGIFLKKYNDFVPAADAPLRQGRKVLLSRNFRSGGAVLEAANHVFRTCMSVRVGGLDYGDAEALIEGIPHEGLGEPEVELHAIAVDADTYAEEAAFAAKRIAQLLDGTHRIRDGAGQRLIQPEDIVILLRSPGSVGSQFRQALGQMGIPCSSGSGGDLLQTQEVETFRSLLQIIDNPRQDIPLLAVLASPVFGFTAEELAAIRANTRGAAFYEALTREDSPKVRAFLDTLQDLRQVERLRELPDLLEVILRKTRMDSIFAAMDDGARRLSSFQAFYQYAVDYASGGQRDLGQFLTHLQLLEEQGLPASDDCDAGNVRIMSIHKSKGLEFPVVLLCGLSREFNRESLRAQVLCHQELGLGLSCVDPENRVRYPSAAKRAIAARISGESLSEEMRVLYVAMTRARDRLIMTYASRSLQSDLQGLAARMDMGARELLTASASCPGTWVLLAALRRTEAGELFSMAGKPRETAVSAVPWCIRVEQGCSEDRSAAPAEEQSFTLPEETLERMATGLAFRYGHLEATKAPSKLTATQLKGREKDREAAQNAREPRPASRAWRKPDFAGAPHAAQGKDRGSAIHAAMQYIRYENCKDEHGVEEELRRLVEERYLTAEQGALVDTAQIAAFFATELGQRLVRGGEVVREFKFSILEDASRFGEGLSGEKVLLQGVVDCALIEEDGIILLDFKTDRVTEQTMPERAAQYNPQVRAYAKALARIYERPVKEALLYFFCVNAYVPVPITSQDPPAEGSAP